MPDLEDLIAALLSEDDQIAEGAALEFCKHGSVALKALEPLLSDSNPDHRWWALRALAAFEDPNLTDHFIDGLGDPDIAVRQCAALALRNTPDPYAIPELIHALGEEDRILSRLACDAMVALDKQATQPLLEMIKNGKNQTARLQAVRALAMIGDEASITVLFQMLDGDSRLMEYWANLGLEKMGVGMTFFSPDS